MIRFLKRIQILRSTNHSVLKTNNSSSGNMFYLFSPVHPCPLIPLVWFFGKSAHSVMATNHVMSRDCGNRALMSCKGGSLGWFQSHPFCILLLRVFVYTTPVAVELNKRPFPLYAVRWGWDILILIFFPNDHQGYSPLFKAFLRVVPIFR